MQQHSIHLVDEFHTAFGHPVEEEPTVSTPSTRVLRVKLIAEELTELCFALGVNLHVQVKPPMPSYGYEGAVILDVSSNPDAPTDIVEVADALGDLDYVVQGANLCFGIPAPAVVAEIHRSNMSKLGEDGKPIYRNDGKIMKGPHYTPPNLQPLLDGTA